MHFSPPPLSRWLMLLSVLRRWFCCCGWSIVYCTSNRLWEFCVCVCFAMHSAQTACLVVNPVTFDNFAFLINSMLAGGNSGHMTIRWDGSGLMLCLLSGPPGFNCLIGFVSILSCMYGWVFIFFISFLYLHLYVLGDDSWISKGSFMRTKHIFIHIRIKGEVCIVLVL